MTATERALERGERPSGERGRAWRMGIESLRALKSKRRELVEKSPSFILSVRSLKAATSSTTIFPPGCSGVATIAEEFELEEEFALILLLANMILLEEFEIVEIGLREGERKVKL